MFTVCVMHAWIICYACILYSWRHYKWHSRFPQFLSPGCINFKNLCAHHKEEVLRIPKHPQLAKFG